MGRTRSAYPPEFREQMVALVRAGRTPEELAREFEPATPRVGRIGISRYRLDSVGSVDRGPWEAVSSNEGHRTQLEVTQMPLSMAVTRLRSPRLRSAPCSAERNKVRVTSRGLTGGT